MNNLIYSNNLRALRNTYSISQEQLALDLKIDRKTIGRIERGENNPSLDVAYRISAYFEKMISDVFPLIEDNTFPTFRQTKAPTERS